MINKIAKIEEFIAMVFLAAIVVFVFIAALMRTLGYPIIWSVDMAQLLFVWLCMLGANQALRKNEHVGVDFLVRRLPLPHRLKLDIVLYLLVSILLAILIVSGSQLTLLNPERLLGSSGLPYALVTAAIPFGGLLMLLTTILKILSLLQQVKTGESL